MGLSDTDDASVTYPLGPALDFMQRIWHLNHALERLSGRMQKRLGVTAQQRLVLRCIGKYPGLTAGQLASLLRVDPGTTSAALRRLESRGLVERRRHPRDLRRTVLGLTSAGRALDQPIEGTVEHALGRLLDSTPSNHLQSTHLVIDRLTALIEAELPG